MAENRKLSELAPTSAQASDSLLISRGGTSYRVTAQSVAVLGGFQPLDSDLTAIASLGTTTYGRGLLTMADAATLRANAGLAIGVNVQAYSARLAALASLTPTTGSVPFFNGSGNLAQDNANLFWDDTNDRLGVGTASPNSTFHVLRSTASVTARVQSTFADGNATLSLQNDAQDWQWIVAGSAADQLILRNATAGVNILSFDTTVPANLVKFSGNGSGSVGINEQSPDYKLDVNGSFGFTPGTNVTPVENGDVTIDMPSNTQVRIRAKGTDGTVRSITLTIA